MQPDDAFRLAALGPADLTAVASSAVGRNVAEPTATAAPINYDWGSPVTGGLWRVDVASGGVEVCTFFVKLVHHTRLWPALSHFPDDEARAEFVD